MVGRVKYQPEVTLHGQLISQSQHFSLQLLPPQTQENLLYELKCVNHAFWVVQMKCICQAEE